MEVNKRIGKRPFKQLKKIGIESEDELLIKNKHLFNEEIRKKFDGLAAYMSTLPGSTKELEHALTVLEDSFLWTKNSLDKKESEIVRLL